MPTPISISSSPSSKSGEPFAGGVQAVSATPIVRVTELTRLAESRRGRLQVRTLLGGRADALTTKKLRHATAAEVYVASGTATSSSTTSVRS